MIRPEDEPKINQITVALRLSKESACILLVSFNDELLRRDVEAEIKRRLEPEGFNFREFRVTGDGYRNLPIMLVDMKPQPEDIFLISDLKKATPEVLEYLNYRREDFVEHNISAIFWLDEPTLTQIARKALDFWAFRSMTFEFNVDRSQDIMIRGQTVLGEILAFAYNSLEELNSKIAFWEEMLEYYLEKQPQDHSTIAGLHKNLGVSYYCKSQFDEAMAQYQKALSLYRELGDRRGEADALGRIGSVYWVRGDLDKVLEYDSRALEISASSPYVREKSIQLANMGVIYWAKGDLDKALKYLSQALEISHSTKNDFVEAYVLGYIGLVYQAKGDLDKALKYRLQSLKINRRIGYLRGEAYDLNSIGFVYQAIGDLDKALEYHAEALEEHRKIGDARGEANALTGIGLVYRRKGDLRIALDHIREALRIQIRIGIGMDIDKSYRSLQEIIERIEAAGAVLPEEDRKEIAELTEEYEKLKGEAAGVTSD